MNTFKYCSFFFLPFYRQDKDRKKKKPPPKWKLDKEAKIKEREVPQYSSALFFKYNTQLGPPYYVLVDTNFVNFSIKNKVDMVQGMMDCLYAKCKTGVFIIPTMIVLTILIYPGCNPDTDSEDLT